MTTAEKAGCIIAIVIQLGVIIYFIRRGRRLRKESLKPEASPDTYEGMRNLALKVTADHLKLTVPGNTTLVFGVVMDWNLNESVMTLAAFVTGAANLYLSTGEGFSGGGKDPRVGEAAATFVASSQEFLGRAMPVTTTDLPPKGCIRFYLMTNKGLFAAQELMEHFEDASSPWLRLFESGSEVITEIRSSRNVLIPE